MTNIIRGMKNILSILLYLVVFSGAFAQVTEPAFIGEVHVLNGNSSICLEKKRASVETKAGVSMYIVGMGKISSKITVDNSNSQIRLDPNSELKFIVKTRDNNIDPISIVNFFKFIHTSPRKNIRYAEVSSVGTFSGASTNNFDFIDFKAEKYGESSYLLTVLGLDVGEYGIIVNDPSMTGSKITVISCFGIGTIEDYNKTSTNNDYQYEEPLYDGD